MYCYKHLLLGNRREVVTVTSVTDRKVIYVRLIKQQSVSYWTERQEFGGGGGGGGRGEEGGGGGSPR